MDKQARINAYMFSGFVAVIVLVICVGVYTLWGKAVHAVHGDDSHGPTQAVAAGPAAAMSSDAQASNTHPGLTKIQASDCRTCHKAAEKLIGPSYQDIAARYAEETEETIETLVGKIKNGGTGNWGNVPMTPHSNLSDSDIRQMVEYILTLND